MTEVVCRPVFATRHPLLIAGVRELLLIAGIAIEPQVVAPEDLGPALARADRCLVIVDAGSLPHRDTLQQLCRSSQGSFFVLWTAWPTADLLQTAVECGVHGLLSTRLPLEEAAHALLRICRGERLFRFDVNPGPETASKPLQFSSRERQVLFELVGGATNAAIAGALHTTESTVKVCLSRMFRKTGARTRQELLKLNRNGILSDAMHPKQPGAASFDAQWMLGSKDPRRGEI